MTRRYAILQGVGFPDRPTHSSQNWPEMWRKWPHLVIQGPSGQLAILPAVSGLGTTGGGTGHANTQLGVAASQHNYVGLMNHKAISFKHNSIVHFWLSNLAAGTDPGFLWHPYNNAVHLNQGGPNFDTNNSLDDYLIFDGFHHTLHIFGNDNKEAGCGGISVQDGVLWARTSDVNGATYMYGNWTGELPFVAQASPLHYFPAPRMFGNPGEQDEKFFFPDGRNSLSTRTIQGGVDYRYAQTSNPQDQVQGICDIAEHEGSIYYCSQQAVWANRIGMKGSFIYAGYFHNRQDEWGGDSVVGLSQVDTTRGSQAQFNDPQMRVFAKHNGSLYMLQNDGKMFTVDPHGITQIANLATDITNSPYGSGIKGGSLQEVPNAPTRPTTPRAFRPFLISFNRQLHAFLTYEMTNTVMQQRTGTAVAKSSFSSSVQGIGWFTSYDGANWSDRTPNLANASQSGIITPSGNNQSVVSWRNTTAPFIHSALQNTHYPSGYGASAPSATGPELKPSGFRQATGQPTEASSRHLGGFASGWGDTDRLPIWNSGMFLDTPGTAFNNLGARMDKGTVSGFLYPTIVNYPSGYAYINGNQLNGTTVPTNLLPAVSGGVWGPFRQGATGWDFTGVRGRHVTGYINDADDKTNNNTLVLCFSDNPNNLDNENQVASHFFELNKSSGWHQMNYVHWGGAFCGGYQRADIYDPEVIIPSGSFADPNPLVDMERGWLKIKFNVIDFGFWDNVSMKFSYTTDEGINWKDGTIASGSMGPLSTSTKQADPSGLIGGSHTIWWDYKSDIGGNEFHPLVRIRLRAEVA